MAWSFRFVEQILTFWSYRYCGLVCPIEMRFDCWKRNIICIFDAILYHNLHLWSQYLNLSQSLIATQEVFPLTLRPVYRYWNDGLISILKFSLTRESEACIWGKDSMEKPLKMCQPNSWQDVTRFVRRFHSRLALLRLINRYSRKDQWFKFIFVKLSY